MMAEGFAAQQVKLLKNISRKQRIKRFDRERRLGIKKRKKVEPKKETPITLYQKEAIKKKVTQDRIKERVKNLVIFIISIFVTFLILKILFSPFKEVL